MLLEGMQVVRHTPDRFFGEVYKVKKLILVLVILVLLLALVPGVAQAKKPFRATTEHVFVGPPTDISWQGTIYLEDGAELGTITWFEDPFMRFTGQASHWANDWEIVDESGELKMSGFSSGSTTARHGKNSNWRSNGTVLEAYGDFDGWQGRNVHESGNFEWSLTGPFPSHGESIFRVN